jgi:hypothetical protein
MTVFLFASMTLAPYLGGLVGPAVSVSGLPRDDGRLRLRLLPLEDQGCLTGPAVTVDRVPLQVRFLPAGARGPRRGRVARLHGREVRIADSFAATRRPSAGPGGERVQGFRTSKQAAMTLESFFQMSAASCQARFDPDHAARLLRNRKIEARRPVEVREENLASFTQAVLNVHGVAFVPRRRGAERLWEPRMLGEVALGPGDYESVGLERVPEGAKRYELLATRVALRTLGARAAMDAIGELLRRRAPFAFARVEGRELVLGDLGPQLAETVALVQALDEDARR